MEVIPLDYPVYYPAPVYGDLGDGEKILTGPQKGDTISKKRREGLKMKKISDGWHKIFGYDVYVEDGKILRGTKKDINGSEVAAYPYKRYDGPGGGWTECVGITVGAFRARVNRGTAIMN